MPTNGLCSKNTLCISIYNNTEEKIFLPEIKGLPAGLRIFLISDNNSFIDISDNAKILSSFCYSEKNYKTIKSCCNLTDYVEYLSDTERDSTASVIAERIKNKDERILALAKERINRLLKELIFIEPKQSYNDYFPLSDSIKYKKLAIFYAYPYPYPVIRTGPTAISEEQIKYNKKLMDSLHFEYPKYIRGYELYDRPIYSEAVVINLE